MTTRRTDFWDFIIKKVCPVLSIVGAILYGCYYAGGHFTTIENSQVEFKSDIKDLKNHVGRLDTGQTSIKEDLNAFKTKYTHDREIDSIKHYYQSVRSTQRSDVQSGRLMGEIRDAKGHIHLIPATN